MNRIIKYFLLIFIISSGIISDQLSKNWAVKNLKHKPVFVVINNVLELGYTENRGMVFGINNRNNNSSSKNILLFIRISMSIALIIYILLNHKKQLSHHIPFLLLLSGAIGNIIDSLRFKYVIDFIHMHAGDLLDWPFLYNLADAYVCIGMALLIIQSFIKNRKTRTVNTPHMEHESS